jgi:hypothetical protein
MREGFKVVDRIVVPQVPLDSTVRYLSKASDGKASLLISLPQNNVQTIKPKLSSPHPKGHILNARITYELNAESQSLRA